MKAAVFFLFLVSCILAANASRRRHRCPKYRVKFFIRTSRSASELNDIVRRFQRALGGRNNMNRIGPIANGFRQASTKIYPLLSFPQMSDLQEIHLLTLTKVLLIVSYLFA